ncbi:DUF2637 domain-containing protein [Micromonospora sp. D93]|uniref:DUF2637 domain-containing protein n=1 Tax=Micromonospora sp. D93 TaxID=2824886 RepID=UPI001B38A656|nr:DUF2637 domain-containing protein [Micromonospora sp. D93]MBQ1017995.1 DUF2637 domain-containing protein [Micromonospora sp. D93]
MSETRLQRMQWAVRATLTLGVAASVTANILHAQTNPISQAIAAWPPLALLITVELVTRVPVHRRALGVLRVIAASAIAGIAAWISYHHMVGVVAQYGETGTVPYLLPLSVDGLIIVASISLVELAARRRECEGQPHPAPAESPPAPPYPNAHPAPATESLSTVPAAVSPLPKRSPAGIDAGVRRRGEVPDLAEHPLDGHSSQDSAGDRALDGDPHNDDDPDDSDRDLPSDLVPLLPAARAACTELTREGRAVSRDALARRLRRNGHSIRNSGVSELLTALRRKN